MQKVEAPPPSRWPTRAMMQVTTATPMTLSPTSFAGAGEAGLDHGGDVFKAVAAADDQNEREEGGPYDKGDGGLRLALEERDDDGNDGQQTKDADDGITHEIFPFFLKSTANMVRS